LRLFIALHLEGSIRNQLSRLQAGLRTADASREVRWVDPEAMHLTLRFLGETPEPAVPGLVAALGARLEGKRCIRLGLAGIGGFPSLKRPRVVWVGLGGELATLGVLQQQIESAVTAAGWPAENRPFQPHLTLGRVRNPGHPLAPKLDAVIGSVRIATQVEAHPRLALVRSHLGPAGSHYEDLARWDLGA
jgi:2'-5' RNA ligase